MYQKVLIPLDGSKEAEEVFPLVQNELTEEGEVILVQVISPARTQKIGEHIILASQQEEADRSEAMAYLRSLARQQDWVRRQLEAGGRSSKFGGRRNSPVG